MPIKKASGALTLVGRESPPPASDAKLLLSILNSMADGVAVVDRRGRFLLFNEAARRFLGHLKATGPLRKRPENLGLYHADGLTLYSLDDLPVARAMRGESIDGEEMFVRPPGAAEGIWVSATARPLRGARGTIRGGLMVARDITAAKLACQAARDSERQYRAVIAASSDAILGFDANRRIVFANPAAGRIFGYSEVELAGRDLTMLMPERSREEYRRAFEDHFLHRRPQRAFMGSPVAGLHRTGREIELEASYGDLVKDGQRIFTAFLRDATERQRAQRELEMSTERFRLLARATNDLVWDWDMTTNQVWRSQAVSTLLAPPESELAGDSLSCWQERIHPEDRVRVMQSIDAAIESQAESWSSEYRYLLADGSYADVLDRGYLMRDAAGAPIRAIGALMDTTSRKRVDEVLLRSEERYRLLFDDSPQPMFVYDADTLQVLAVNEALMALHGYTREELLSMTLIDLRPADEVPRLLEHVKRSLHRNNTYGQFRQKKKDGTLLYVEARGSATRFSGHNARLVSLTDITAQKKLEEDLWQARKMEEIGRLTSGIAHDFNN
ncbi:MAG: PAS domain S-box protein, partial [Bryobacteraceae bacterium]